MAARNLPGLGLTGYWPLGAEYKTGMDENLRRLSALVQPRVLSKTTDLPVAPQAGDIYIVPSGAASNANDIAIFDGETGSEQWVYITPATGFQVFVLDTGLMARFGDLGWQDVLDGSAPPPQPYDFGFAAEATPQADAVLGRVVIPRALTLPANFDGARGAVATAPTATFAVDVQRNGTSIGTISVATSGAFTFSTTGGALSVAAGDVITFVAPTTPDSTVAGISATLTAILEAAG